MTEPTPTISEGPEASESPPIGSVTILIREWAPGASEVQLLLPGEAQPGQPDALAQQAVFRARVIADLDDALNILGGP